MRPVTVLPTASSTDPAPFADPAPLVEPTDVGSLAGLSTAQLSDRLMTWAGRIAAGEARLLLYLGEFDERKGWSGTGVLSCAHWLSWRLGLSLKAASEKVRVAGALRKLPRIRAAFCAGQVSYSQVRALTRISTADNEERYLRVGRCATGSQLDRLVRGIRRAQKGRDRDAARARGETPPAAKPYLRTRYDDDGNLVLTLRCTAEDGAVLLAALDAARDDLDRPGGTDPTNPSPVPAGAESSAEDSPAEDIADDEGPGRASLSDALLALGRRYLDVRGWTAPAKARRDRSKLVVHLDPLSGWSRLPDGEFLPPGTAGVTMPTGPLRPFGGLDRTRFDAGRSSRDIPQALRDLLGSLDGERCRYPSCTRTRKLHAHHIRFWSDGGRTDLANLVLLCSRHHTVVHAAGIRLGLDPWSRALTVTTSTGQAVPHRPALPLEPAADLDPHRTIDAGTLPPQNGGKLDLHYAVSVLMQWAA